MTDVLIMHSTAFASQPPLDGDGRFYDSPLGDDVARFLVSRLSDASDRFRFGDVIREDSWSTCDCEVGDAKLYFVVSYFPVDDRDDGWVIQFGQRRGLLWFLTKRRPDLLDQLIEAFHGVLGSETDKFTDVSRVSEDAFQSKS